MRFPNRFDSKFLKNPLHRHRLPDAALQLRNRHAHLFGGVAVADGHGVVFQRLVVHGDAERRADEVLAGVALADAVAFFVKHVEIVLQQVLNLAGFFGQTVFFHQGQNRRLDGGHGRVEFQKRAGFRLLAFARRFLRVGVAEHGQEQSVGPDGGFDHVGDVVAVGFAFGVEVVVEVLLLLFGQFLVGLQVEIRPAVDAFDFAESERELVLDVHGGVGVMGQLVVVVEFQFFGGQAHGLMKFHPHGFPVLVPVHLGAGAAEKLHFHLLEFAHPEGELPGHDLVAKRLADLGDAEGNFHPPGFLHVQEIDENALGRFGAEVNQAGVVADGPDLGAEHEVKLPHLGPVGRARKGADDFLVDDQLPDAFQIPRVEEAAHAVEQGLAAFGVAGVHENGRVDAHYVVVEHGHGLPPESFEVVFEFDAVLAVVVHGLKAVVNFGGGKNKAVFLGVGDDVLEGSGRSLRSRVHRRQKYGSSGNGVGLGWGESVKTVSFARQAHSPTMLINSLSLKNFKCFEEVDVKFAPITLLTGANSSGKSSLINAILAVLQTRDFPYFFSPNGQFINMGSFQEIVHLGNRNKQIEVDLSFSDITNFYIPGKPQTDHFTNVVNVKTKWKRDVKNDLPTLNGLSYDSFGFKMDMGKGANKFIFNLYDESGESYLDWNGESYTTPFDKFISKENINIEFLKHKDERVPFAKAILNIKKAQFSSFQDMLDKIINFEESNWSMTQLRRRLINQLTFLGLEFNYIGSFRNPPERTYYQKPPSTNKVNVTGEGYIDQIIDWEDNNAHEFSKFKKIIRKLNILHDIKALKLKGGRFELNVSTHNTNQYASLTDVGFGISQFLPIIVADLQLTTQSCLTVSQPEIHLHPRIQATFGDYIAEQVRKTQKQYILETHSEYLLNRIRLLLVKGELKPEDVKVYYFENDGIKSIVHEVEFATDGQIKGAPSGFFETYMMDLMDIALNAVK